MITNKIKQVTIENLWGIKNISTEFNERVNIFIGTNGSSKTTFLNLIEATLLVDLSMLISVEFNKIIIRFTSSEIKFLTIKKCLLDESLFISYQFDDSDEYMISCGEVLQRQNRLPYRSKEKYIVEEKLSSIIKISWLSINRDNFSSFNYDRRDFIEKFRNMVDLKLEELVRRLILYQLQLESEANKKAHKFKEDVLSLMLYNEEYDVYSKDIIERFQSTDTKLMEEDLMTAFNVLGVIKDKNEAINNHIQKIKDVIIKISKKETVLLDDVFILSLINRTLSIIQISKEHEKQINEIYSPINNFWDCLKSFMPNKEFSIIKEREGDIIIHLNESQITNNITINTTELSSGEKQLFILLAEALLQKESPFLFIADEPELSLHIGWQKRILNELLKLNPNAQIIVATHSPEVAGHFPENIINMKTITNYEQFNS